ncbi:MAG: tRNA (adenosine(37)-N6)-threonylcarbamoyltransferase complex dimerization subunit type 1 TsaB [Phycisphaerae bacterium]|jgi:tRNA threonylcarbamoyl adenosine modification protein YeaZ|nr:tRNA (adenosine(37)-N6)-threonylcarbamoyltransferase complex dimerization subunit type 1 TsaB [Phycisphaerae bacterium]
MPSGYPISLAIELSQKQGSVAIMDKSGETKEHTVQIGNRDKDHIMPAIQSLASNLHITPTDIEMVAVSVGPGGFTGLRTSITIAKIISLVSGAKIVAVDSAVVVAASSGLGTGPFCAVSAVKQNYFWFSFVHQEGDLWFCKSQHTKTDDFPSISSAKTLFADTYLPPEIANAAEHQGVPIAMVHPTAQTLLRVALPMHEQSTHTEAHALVPIYPREPEAVRLWKSRTK